MRANYSQRGAHMSASFANHRTREDVRLALGRWSTVLRMANEDEAERSGGHDAASGAQNDAEAADYLPSPEFRTAKGARLVFPLSGSRPKPPPFVNYEQIVAAQSRRIDAIKNMPKVRNPTLDVLEESRATNDLLAKMLDLARADAENARAEARTARLQTWAAIGVTVAVGIAQIVLSIIQLGRP